MSRRVVITGTGAVSPLGQGSAPLIDRWSAAESGIRDGLARCDDFDSTIELTKKERRRTDRFTQMAIVAAAEALDEAGWDGEAPYPGDRVGVILGSGVGGIGTIEQQQAELQSDRPPSPFLITMMMGNAAVAAISMRYDLTGPSYGIFSACASGAHALGAGFRAIQHGEADAVVAGGSEAAVTDLAAGAFTAMGAMSPTGVSRPFDARRDGFVLGEGAGVMVLEEAEAAERRGATILGEVLGYSATSDAFHLTAPKPGGAGAVRAMAHALDEAGVAPGELDYVNAHGTSTPLNDRCETAALKEVLGEDAQRVPVSSLKSAIGHTLGAAGAIEAVATLHALRRGIAPPTLNFGEREEGMDLDYVPETRPLGPPARPNGNGHVRRIAISNSFGFGGHNAVICLAGDAAA